MVGDTGLESLKIAGGLRTLLRHFEAFIEDMLRIAKDCPGRPGAFAVLHVCEQRNFRRRSWLWCIAAAFNVITRLRTAQIRCKEKR
jgi:hypothetical protein